MITIKKRMTVFAAALLLPALVWASVSGIPSRPKFIDAEIADRTTTAGDGGGYCQIGTWPSGTNQQQNLRESCDFSKANGNFSVFAAGQANWQGKQNSNFYARLGTGAAPGGTSIETYLQFLRFDRSVYPEASAIFLWSLGYTPSNLPGANAGHNFCVKRHDDTGLVIDGGDGCTLKINRATGQLSSERSAATGYTRISPNYSGRGAGSNLLTAVGTCVDVGGSVANALGRDYLLDVQIYGDNAVGARAVAIGFYTDAACTANVESRTFSVYEFSAVVNTTLIYRAETSVRTSADHRYAKIISKTGGGATGVLVYAQGYYD